MASWTLTGTTTSPTYWKVRAVVTEQSQSIANNTTTLKVSLQLGRDVISSYLYSYNTNWYINVGSDHSGTQTISTWNWDPATAGSWKEIASRTVTVSHDADGTKKNLSISCKWFNTSITPSEATVSGSVNLTTIPRATTPSTPISGNIGSAVTITLPRASNTFTHTLTYTFGQASGTIGTGIGASASWTMPWALANQIPKATSGTGTITCKTYSGSTLIGTKSVSFTAKIPASVVPTIDSLTISEATAKVIDAGFTVFVQNKSKLKIVTAASGARGSTVSKISVTVNGKTYTGSNVTSAVITASGNLAVSVKATDSRGRVSETRNTVVTVAAYTSPTATVSGLRADSTGSADPVGEYLRYSVKYSITNVRDGAQSENTALYQLQYKRSSASSWTVLDTATSYSQTITNALSSAAILNIDNPYNLRVMLRDSFGTYYFNAANIPTGYTTVDYHESGRGIAFGKVAEQGDLFDCAMPAKFRSTMVDADGSPINWLHNPITVADGDNLNSKVLPGLYYRISGSVSNITNFPSGESEFFYMLVTRETSGANAGFVLQRLLFYRVGREYVRRKTSGSDGSWQSWVCISGVDVVVERGASGGWTYEKWRSGKIVAETSGSQSVSFSTQFGSTGLYRGTLSLSHPSGLFSSIASRELVPNAAYIFFTGGLATSSDASKSDFFVYRTSGTSTIYYYCRIVGT